MIRAVNDGTLALVVMVMANSDLELLASPSWRFQRTRFSMLSLFQIRRHEVSVTVHPGPQVQWSSAFG